MILVEDAHWYNFFYCNTRIVLSLLYISYFTYHRLWNNIQETGNISKLGRSDQRDFVQLGISTLNCSNEILTRKDNWLAYKAGKSAACHGTWFVAAFIFRKLIKLAQSHSCVSWLNLLADFAHSEMYIQFLTFPKQCSDLLNCLESRGISTSTLGSPNHIDNLVNACNILHSSVGRLNIISRSDTAFSFQHWLLSLRARVLGNVVDMFRLLDTISDAKDDSNQHTNEVNMVENSQCSQTLNSLVDHLTQISIKFRRLAQELDLIPISFIGDGDFDHYSWERAEDMTTPRTAYKLDTNNPFSDLAGETAASLAFKPYDSSYSNLLLVHAKQLFSFAVGFRGLSIDSIPNSKKFYASSGYRDDLLWAAAWLHQAIKEYYLKYVVDNAVSMGGTSNSSRDNKYAGVQILLSKVFLEGNGGAYTSSTLKQYRPRQIILHVLVNKRMMDTNTMPL
ncbi:hypothetical protein POM88_040217 [Heracleum sosnowskyi]|uniref:cellulase n=1 Tax=Heracleum sosnowskyi TaxID=360622 RepID=A0AAD8HCS5_9APIA|nr:hypothetical protein POM88_040217 [Heracleum sosnowskyi]